MNIEINMTTSAKAFVSPKGTNFVGFLGLPCLEVFVFLQKSNIYHDKCFTKYLVSRKQVSDDLAADVKAKNIVNF